MDLVVGRVRIARSLTVVAGRAHEGPTKTHQIRGIALDDAGVGLLRDHWEYMRDLSERAESPLVKDPFILSYNANGATNVGPDFITHRFASLAKRLGMAYRFHDLRHFSVSTLIAAGVDVRTVAERHGHAQATMTLNRYADALPNETGSPPAYLGRSSAQVNRTTTLNHVIPASAVPAGNGPQDSRPTALPLFIASSWES